MAPLLVSLCSSRRSKTSRMFGHFWVNTSRGLAFLGMKRTIAIRVTRSHGTGKHRGIYLDMASNTSLYKALHIVMSVTGTAMNQRVSRRYAAPNSSSYKGLPS